MAATVLLSIHGVRFGHTNRSKPDLSWDQCDFFLEPKHTGQCQRSWLVMLHWTMIITLRRAQLLWTLTMLPMRVIILCAHNVYHDDTATLTLSPPNYSIWIFTHLTLCLADAIHNFKWVKIIQIWQNGGQLFSNLAGWCHILSLTYFKCGTQCADKKWKPAYMRHRWLKG